MGGGTGEIALQIMSEIKMKKPVVCVEPAKAMFEIASRKEGVISINKTAEEFFSSKPDYPLKVVLMNGCVHLFTNADLVFFRSGQIFTRRWCMCGNFINI